MCFSCSIATVSFNACVSATRYFPCECVCLFCSPDVLVQDALWSLYNIFSRHLDAYISRVLIHRLVFYGGPFFDVSGKQQNAPPQFSAGDARLSEERAVGICTVLNTAESCVETVQQVYRALPGTCPADLCAHVYPQLEKKIHARIDAQYKPNVNMTDICDRFTGCVLVACTNGRCSCAVQRHIYVHLHTCPRSGTRV
jgi:hypothetical protein